MLTTCPNHLRSATTIRRRGFTLVELLVVITIIGILASVASVFMFKGLTAAKQARTAAEVTNLASATEEFRRQYGDYPPSYLDQTDLNALALMKRFLAKAFPRCNPNVEVWFIPWTNSTVSPFVFYPYLDTDGKTVRLWDATTNTNRAIGTGDAPLTPSQALLFWLTGISKDPAHPLSSPSIDRISFFDFDNSRITRLNASSPAWNLVQLTSSPPASVSLVNSQIAVYNPGYYVPRDGNQQAYVYFEARCYLFHALFRTGVNPPGAIPYLSQSAPWDTNSNGVLDVGQPNPAATPPTVYDITTDSTFDILPISFTTFQSLCVKPKSFQIISAGLDNDFGTVNTGYSSGASPETPAPGVAVVYNPNPLLFTTPFNCLIYYKSYPDGQGYDTTTNADDDNITNFSETPLGNAKAQ